MGPTASGKSRLALRLAARHSGQILSVDSMQVYRGMDIGTAKASRAERSATVHHMIDVANPTEDYSVARFQREGREVLDTALSPIVIVGGSGLHFRALVDPLQFPSGDEAVRAGVDALDQGIAVEELLSADAQAAVHVDLSNPRRVQRALEILRLGGGTPSERSRGAAATAVREYRSLYDVAILGLDPGEILGERARRRLDEMIEAGLVDEVAALAERMGRNASRAVGYRQFLDVVGGRLTMDDGYQATLAATRSLAKRQRTYFGRDRRIHWIPWSDDPDELYDRAVTRLDQIE